MIVIETANHHWISVYNSYWNGKPSLDYCIW